MSEPMILSGDENVPAMPLRESEVNHLRRMLGWLRTEMGQTPEEMVTMTNDTAARIGPILDQEGARLRLQAGYDRAASFPAYLRQAEKMLSNALHEHEKRSGVVEAEANRTEKIPVLLEGGKSPF